MKEKEANLGLATTREILMELAARGRAIGSSMGDAPRNGSMGDYLEAAADEILTNLNSSILNYRTVDEE